MMMFDCLSDWFINYLTQNGFWKGKELSNVIWNERRYVLKKIFDWRSSHRLLVSNFQKIQPNASFEAPFVWVLFKNLHLAVFLLIWRQEAKLYEILLKIKGHSDHKPVLQCINEVSSNQTFISSPYTNP